MNDTAQVVSKYVVEVDTLIFYGFDKPLRTVKKQEYVSRKL